MNMPHPCARKPKLITLSPVVYCMRSDKRKQILNSFIRSHFSYHPMVWMFHSKNQNERTNHIHEDVIRILYKDFRSSFQELLIEDNSMSFIAKICQNV